MAGRFTKGSLTVSMIVGTLLVPLSAVLAVWLTGANDPAGAETTASVPPTTLATTPQTTAARITEADIEAACGPDGMQLVTLEAKGTITDVQQAALDALRELCDQRGLSLPDKPAGEPIVRTIVVPDATTGTTTSNPATDDEFESGGDGPHDDDGGVFEEHEEEDD